MHYKAIHKITADGALVTTVNHEFVGEVNMSYYGIIQYNNKSDAFGGGLWKYIPKTLPLNDPAYDFSIPFNMANLVATAYIRKTDWIHPTDVPNRDITYYKNGSNEIVAGFAAGYLPLLDGTNDKLLENLTNTSSFIYTSKKDYPYFTQKNNLTIQGVAYRTYFPVDSIKLHTSSVLVPYEDTYYYYLDYHTTGSETIQLPTELNNKSPILIEKSSNVLYEYSSPNNLNITVGTTTGNNSYLVLKFEITNNGGNGN
ncbi:MAG: hypothetical protein LBO09_07130 [Candidatus Peribacteria bacterium]|jgi:hypothetical protein|nr:hypothetical protein [Candidatus Peribacteria bacterium]